MATPTDLQHDETSAATRRLILRDTLSFLSLTLVTVVLFAITLFLFKSFTAHRAELAQRWSARGTQAIQAQKPEDAIFDLRAALSYAPGTRAYELLLAQALGDAGHTEESYNYFMGLWQTQPGNGLINLQLARLAAKKQDISHRSDDRQAAIDFYRASIYGTWEGDGVARRSSVRLELARYLIGIHDPAPARMELLIAAGNAPETVSLDLTLADLLQQADDVPDAATYFRKALVLDPNNVIALEGAAVVAYNSADFESAHRFFARAQAVRARDHAALSSPQDAAMQANAARLLELAPARNLPRKERVARILAARDLARNRLDACSARLTPAGPLPSPLTALVAQWATPDGTASASALMHDTDQQDDTMQLIYHSEIETATLCGSPTGDDALLLLLANASAVTAPAVPQPAQQKGAAR